MINHFEYSCGAVAKSTVVGDESVVFADDISLLVAKDIGGPCQRHFSTICTTEEVQVTAERGRMQSYNERSKEN